MTGEISIRGRVLPIGGLREKTMAALRHGIRLVIIPKANEKDLEEIDPLVRKGLNFMTAEQVDSVLEAALDFSACTAPVLEDPATVSYTHLKKAPRQKSLSRSRRNCWNPASRRLI